MPRDADEALRQFGEELKDYIRQHVHAWAPDGRPWTVTVREVRPIVEQNPDVWVSLTMTPPPGAAADRLTFPLRQQSSTHLITTRRWSRWPTTGATA